MINYKFDDSFGELFGFVLDLVVVDIVVKLKTKELEIFQHVMLYTKDISQNADVNIFFLCATRNRFLRCLLFLLRTQLQHVSLLCLL